MSVKGAKTIAEYAIRSWLKAQNFDMNYFNLCMDGKEGILKDQAGESMVLVYDPDSRSVYIKNNE